MDAETFIWWIIPLIAAIVSAIYAARKDAGLEERVRRLEQLEAGRQGAESVGLPEQPTVDVSDFKLWRQQAKSNTATLDNHRRRLEALEGETE